MLLATVQVLFSAGTRVVIIVNPAALLVPVTTSVSSVSVAFGLPSVTATPSDHHHYAGETKLWSAPARRGSHRLGLREEAVLVMDSVNNEDGIVITTACKSLA